MADDAAPPERTPDIPDKLFFRIGELAEIVGVEPHVIRYWEQEFRVRPQRSPSGQRMFQRHDIVRFLRIKTLLHTRGFTIQGARKALQGSGDDTPGARVDPVEVEAVLVRLTRVEEAIDALRRRLDAAWNVPAPDGGS